MVTVEAPATQLDKLQRELVDRINQTQEKLASDDMHSDEIGFLLSIGQSGLLVELYESGLRPKQIKETTGIMWGYPSAEEEEKIYESKTSGLIYQADNLLEKLQKEKQKPFEDLQKPKRIGPAKTKVLF